MAFGGFSLATTEAFAIKATFQKGYLGIPIGDSPPRVAHFIRNAGSNFFASGSKKNHDPRGLKIEKALPVIPKPTVTSDSLKDTF